MERLWRFRRSYAPAAWPLPLTVGPSVAWHAQALHPVAPLHTAICKAARTHTHKQQVIVGRASGWDRWEGGRHLLVGRDPQWAGAAGAGRPLAVQAAVAQEAALAALAVLASRVVLTVLEGEDTGGEPNLID